MDTIAAIGLGIAKYRVSGEDRKLQQRVTIHLADGARPVVRHYLTAK